MSGLLKLNSLLLRGAEGITIMAMGAIAVIIPYEVFGRYVLGDMPIWSGEAATYALVWTSMMGAAVGLKKGYQVSLTIVLEKLPPPAARAVQGLAYLLMVVFLLIMIYFGTQQTLINARQISPALGMPMAVPYMALPLGFGLMLLVTLEEIWLFLRPGARAQ